jgi:hypothetical protein
MKKKKAGNLSDRMSKKAVGMDVKKEMKGLKNPVGGFKEENMLAPKGKGKKKKKKEPTVKDYMKGAF